MSWFSGPRYCCCPTPELRPGASDCALELAFLHGRSGTGDSQRDSRESIRANHSQLNPYLGTGKRGHYERGLFAGGISRISKISRFSRISRKWSDSPLFSSVWGFSKISRISKFSRISRKWTFLKRPLFQKTPFSEPDYPSGPIEVNRCLAVKITPQ